MTSIFFLSQGARERFECQWVKAFFTLNTKKKTTKNRGKEVQMDKSSF